MSTKPMSIEVFSDIHCPFCYIGMARLEDALKDFGRPVAITYKSYELNPGAEAGSSDSIYEAVARKQNISIMDAMETYRQISEAGRAAGAQFDMDMVIPTNTFDALRLSHLAKEAGVQVPLMKALFKAHFRDGLDVADHDVLADLGEAVGVERSQVLEMLQSDAFREDVIGDQAAAAFMGISSIPYYVFNEKYGMAGAQTKELFLEALNEAYAN